MNCKLLLTLFPFLICLFSCKKELPINETTLKEFNNILDKNIEIQQERFYKIDREILDDLFEPQKHKYAFLLKAAHKTMAEYEKFDQFFQQKIDSFNLFYLKSNIKFRANIFKDSNNQLSLIDQSIINMFDSLLTKEYKIIGLREEEMKKRLKGIREEYNELQSTLIPQTNNDINNNNLFKIKLKSLKYAAIHKTHFFIEKFRELAGGKIYCAPHYIFPLIQTKKNSVKKGEYFEAKIAIGNHYQFHPLDNPKVIVNGDTLNFNSEEDFINYKFKTKQKGDKKLNLEFFMFNKLTGEKYSSSSEYIVNVN